MDVRTVVTIEDKEIRDLLTEKARDMLAEKGVGSGSTIAIIVDAEGEISATVTFNGKSR